MYLAPFTLALTPLSVADKFKELMAQKPGSWIFTSATLSVNDDLHHFTSRLGIEQAESLLLPSPFDYSRQALLCVPRNLPQTNQPAPHGNWRQCCDRSSKLTTVVVLCFVPRTP